MIEFAVIAPVLLLLVVGAIQLTLIFYQMMVFEAAATAGVRRAAVCTLSDSACSARAVTHSRNVLNATSLPVTGLTVTHSLTGSGVEARDDVTVSANYSTAIPFFRTVNARLTVSADRLRERALHDLPP